MLLGQELKFKNRLCNLKLGTFFSALPGLGAFGLSARFNRTVRMVCLKYGKVSLKNESGFIKSF